MSMFAIEERGSLSTDRWAQREKFEADTPKCDDAESTRDSDADDARPSPKLFALPVIQCCECCLVACVQKRWANCGYTALKHIACRCNDGVLVIDGAVPSYFFKQMAQELARNVDGVRRIENRLSVNDDGGNDPYEERITDDQANE